MDTIESSSGWKQQLLNKRKKKQAYPSGVPAPIDSEVSTTKKQNQVSKHKYKFRIPR